MSITVPEGLSDLLQDFAIVVLREKPKDLVEFAANYFTDLHERSKSGKTESPREDADKQKSPERSINVVISEETVEMQDEGTLVTQSASVVLVLIINNKINTFSHAIPVGNVKAHMNAVGVHELVFIPAI